MWSGPCNVLRSGECLRLLLRLDPLLSAGFGVIELSSRPDGLPCSPSMLASRRGIAIEWSEEPEESKEAASGRLTRGLCAISGIEMSESWGCLYQSPGSSSAGSKTPSSAAGGCKAVAWGRPGCLASMAGLKVSGTTFISSPVASACSIACCGVVPASATPASARGPPQVRWPAVKCHRPCRSS